MDGSSEQSVGAFGSASQDAAGLGMPDSGGSGSSLTSAAADLGSPVSGAGEASGTPPAAGPGTRPAAGLGEADSLASSLEEMKGDFVDLMRRLHQARATSRTVPEGVTPAEARAVHVVWLMSRQGEAARPGSVAAHMHTTPSALSQILKSLEEKGLLVRHRTRDDFRAVALELTDAGSAVAQETERLHVEHAKAVIAYVGEEDFVHLLRTVDRILEFHEQASAHATVSAPEGAVLESAGMACGPGCAACAPADAPARPVASGPAAASTPTASAPVPVAPSEGGLPCE